MEPFNLAQLTKAMVVSQLRKLQDPTLVAADVVRGTILARLKNSQLSPRALHEAVAEICRGAVAGMVLMECPLPRGGAAILRMALDAARLSGLDADATAYAALCGIADAKRFAPPETLQAMSERINTVRLGSGETFLRLCGNAHPYISHPAYVAPA